MIAPEAIARAPDPDQLDELAARIATALAVQLVPTIRQGLADAFAADDRVGNRLLDPADCITMKQAAAIANVDDSTIGRWLAKGIDIGVTVAGAQYISRRKLENYLETIKA
jgi:hypothetical protein